MACELSFSHNLRLRHSLPNIINVSTVKNVNTNTFAGVFPGVTEELQSENKDLL